MSLISTANQISGSQTGSQQRRTPGDAGRRPATIAPANWLFRLRKATSNDDKIAPYKRGAGGSNPPAPLTGCRRVRLERHLRRRWCLSQECPRRRAGLEAVGGTAVRVSICEVRAWRTVPAQPAMPGLAGQPHYVLWAAAARSPVLRPPAPRARAPGPLDPGRGTALCSQRRAALTDPISGQSDPVHTGMRAWLLRSLRPDRVLELDSYRRG
jgi:hypothetical protein